jgi:signal transduction histidine kinase
METAHGADTSAIPYRKVSAIPTTNVTAPLPGGTMLKYPARLVQVVASGKGTETAHMPKIENSASAGELPDNLFAKVERAKREWEATVDSLPELVCLLDHDGCVIRTNRIIEEWQLGEVRHVKGRHLHELLHPDCQDPRCYAAILIRQSIAHALLGEPFQQEAYDPILERYVQIHTHPVKSEVDDSAASIAVVVRDVSERKRSEQERERLIADLNAYAHSVAHDLKNPVGVIIGFADMLERDLDNFSREEIADLVRAIMRSGHKLIDIIDDLLLFAQVQNAEVEVRQLDMGVVVAEAIFRLSHLKTQYHAEIRLPDAWPTALGCAQWVEEVWVNYLSNALKYGGRPPQIQIGSELQPDGYVRCWVRDNGDGIPRETCAQLFTPFTRFAPTRAAGHGLGLSIAQRVIERLGGRVGVESEGVPGAGSLFYFTLPAADPLPAEEPVD